ncbi:MAG TPA: hypothetical protein PL041_06295 [Melioribacteraceae bacterium]|nr:hypothetical protein [Melioribacteraceae bacterium]
MALFQNNVGFNITKSKLQLVEVNFNDTNFILENVDEEFFPDFIEPDVKDTKFISVLRAALNSLLLKKSINSSYSSFLLPFEFFKIVSIPFDNTLLDNDLEDLIKWEFSVLYPNLNCNDFVIRHVKVEESSLLKKNVIIFYALEKRIIKILNKFAAVNNLKIRFLDNVHLAANLNIFASVDFNKLQNSVSLYITEDSINFMVLEGPNIVYSNNFKYNNIHEILDAVKNSFLSLKNVGIDSNLINKAYVFTDSVTDNIIDQIRTKLNVDLIRISPFDTILQSDNIKNNELLQRKILSFSAPLGIVLRLE